MRRIAEGLYQLEAAGFVNAYLIQGASDLTLVDAGPARSAGALLEELRRNGFRLEDIGRVVLTHGHGDHSGGVIPFLRRRGAVKVYAHPLEIPSLTGKAPLPAPPGWAGRVAVRAQARLWPSEPLEVVVAAEPGMPIKGLGSWQVLHTPGHTDGGLSLFEPVRQILICGDIAVQRGGALRLPPAFLNRDPEALKASLKRAAGLDCDILCCGHGEALVGGAFRHIERLINGA